MADRKRLSDILTDAERERLIEAWNAVPSYPRKGARVEANRGIRTLHKNRWYRSLLEARWAAMFDLLRWPYEYEPFELDGWIPDFILTGAHPVLVEVKPVVAFPHDVAEKVTQSGTEHEVLIVGCTIPVRAGDGTRDDPPHFGWLLDREFYYGANGDRNVPTWGGAVLGRWIGGKGQIGFCHHEGSYHDRISGSYDGCCGGEGRPALTLDEIKQLWAAAGNNTQWRRSP